jgi:transposase
MLEGSKKSGWYLWGFSTPESSFFEIHDTRSGDVASQILLRSKCEYLISDVYSGYGKAVRETNKVRSTDGLPIIENVYCNAHARRRFKEAKDRFPEDARYFIDQYKLIYKLEAESKDKPHDEVLKLRSQMVPIFNAMKMRSMSEIAGYSLKSSIGKAMSYFLGNFAQLTLFIANASLPIDNNPQERLMRSPVIGRKTWYGTHSERGAETTAILFSIVESCKLNHLNPREYLRDLVQDLHQRKPAFTPREYKNRPH